MVMHKELMIQAEDALRAVRDLVNNDPNLEDVGGFVEEMLSIGDGGFLIMYTTDNGVMYFAADDDTVSQIELSEYDLAKSGAEEITEFVPELMERVNASH